MAESLRVLIEEAEFKESFRGYDRNQVDDLLEQLAARVSRLETESSRAAESVRNAEDKARAEAEAQIEERVQAELANRPGVAGVSEEEAAERLRRTLVLAQRTADAAIDEARHEANQLLAQAHQEADELTSSSQAQAETLTTEAHADAERLRLEAQGEHERIIADAKTLNERLTAEAHAEAERSKAESTSQLAEETASLQATRTELIADVARLELHVDKQRSRLRDSVTALQRLLDDPGSFEITPLPDSDTAVEATDQEGEESTEPDIITVDHAEPDLVIADEVLAPDSGDGPSDQSAGDDDSFLVDLKQAMDDDETSNGDSGRSTQSSGSARLAGSRPGGNKVSNQDAGRPPKFGRRR